MNEAYRALLDARVQGAVAVAKAYSSLHHNLLIGELREIVVRDLLRPFFPSDIGVGTGEIVSAVEGAGHSAQQDVILFNRQILPPLLGDERTGLFPIESVIATLEIKSLLNLEELKKAHTNAKTVHRLELQSGGDKEKEKAAAGIPRLTCLLAFDTDLKVGGKHEISRYEEIRDGRYSQPPSKEDQKGKTGILIPKDDPPSLMVICVVGRGLWMWHYGRMEYLAASRTRPFDEVVALVTILGNTYKTVTELRGQPPIGRYLFPLREQIFDSIPFEILHPDLAAKANDSAAKVVAEALKKQSPPPSEDSLRQEPPK